MFNLRVKSLAAIIAALACGGAFAQSSNQMPAPAAGGSQQGVVYPGRPMVQGSAPSAPSASMPATSGALPGGHVNTPTPGAPIGQMPPLPPQAGAPAPIASPAQLYVEDNMPSDLPSAIKEYKRRFDEAQRASAAYTNTAAKPISRGITITQMPGEPSPTVRLASGVPTNVVFTDSTGAAWPIEFATPGDLSLVDVLVPVDGSATLQIRPKQPYMYGAISVNLRGNMVPVTLILASAQDQVDTRIDARIARRGPNAQAPVIDRPGFTNVDETLMAVLDGVAPTDAKVMKSSSADLRAWSYKGKLYVRTNMSIVSPAYFDSAASVDGTRVFVLPPVPSVTVSVDGVLRIVNISGE